MDDKVKQLLEKVREAASAVGGAAAETVAYAGKKTGEVLEIAKINVQIFDLSSEIGVLQKELGQMVYKTHRGEEVDAEELDNKLFAIDEKIERIDELKARIAVLRQGEVCPDCGETVSKSDKFCRECGKVLEHTEEECCNCCCGGDDATCEEEEKLDEDEF